MGLRWEALVFLTPLWLLRDKTAFHFAGNDDVCTLMPPEDDKYCGKFSVKKKIW